ncbi:lipoxygenase 2, chloroplastic-like [Rutidosis leptorrhynchoides]|uniref:lipoxygenase 2, chloroplastic-like n=1 Tax=Rutidosis leptorrhynchoides TaxID=125765 RepID=UPI003A9A2760
MLKPQINQSYSLQKLLPLHKRFISGDAANHSSSSAYSPAILRKLPSSKIFSATRTMSAGNIKAMSIPCPTVECVITIQPTVPIKGVSFSLEFVSNDLDSNGKRKTVQTKVGIFDTTEATSSLLCNFDVPPKFGEIGAVLVENLSEKLFFKNIVLSNDVTFACNSWVHSKDDNPHKRIFFTNKSTYLPSETPNALLELRAKDLESLRGNGQGERKSSDRIYGYDVYNDLGAPDDISKDLARPVLGGEQHPYPRRCRTGRNMSSADEMMETRNSLQFYVPADENFSEINQAKFRTLYYMLNGVLPALESMLPKEEKDKGFSLFTDINLLYYKGLDIDVPIKINPNDLPRLVKRAADTENTVIKFETPVTMDMDTFSWFRDDEFCRQMLAGLNPCSIQLVTVKEEPEIEEKSTASGVDKNLESAPPCNHKVIWPLMSKLDPKVYGPAESAITKEIVEEEIKSFMTLEEALAQKKLFMLDYHDLLLPYVNKTNELKGRALYGSRTLMFLTPNGTLRPIAIELTRPPIDGKRQWKKVYTPSSDATGAWLWKLAKAHVLAHDSGYHQLVSHWLRTHCVTEPYIIAANRHLSQMHPIKRLLNPHFRYTMEINALARLALINAGGIIENTFSPGKYCMQLCSDAYDKFWRFDHEALPADLISRGMAVEDPTATHGLKLTIEDYPFANDGLLVFDAIKQWVTSYVNHYYPQGDPVETVESDKELQAWWDEIYTDGHGDKKDEPWWPKLKTQDDLIGIVSTIMWVTSGHHSAVNFGQYDFAGYFPNRPTISRTKMPDDNPTDEEWESFIKRPEDVLLKCFPSQIQATQVMAVLDVLSSHSLDEEYIGGNIEAAWEAEPAIKNAFEEFRSRLNELEGIIDSRNNDPKFKNRCGAGLVPYQLLKPYSEKGVTGMGVPNSISI